MCKIYSYVVVFYLAITICHGNVLPDDDGALIRFPREIPDECRPFPPPSAHRHHPHQGPEENGRKMPPMCCPLPDIMPADRPESFDKCHEMVFGSDSPHDHGAHKPGGAKNLKRSSGDGPGDSSKENAGSPPVPPPPGFSQEKKECFFNCVFNVSGLLTGDGLLNEDLLSEKLLKTAVNNTKWTSTVDPVFKKCVAAAKEANSQSQKPCKQGAAEYLKCMSRELFFNCPSDLWVNSAECNEFKNKLEKCPNLWAPHPHPPSLHHNHHNHHHHHNRHHDHQGDHQ